MLTFLLWLSCTTDVSIMKTNQPDVTVIDSGVIIDTNDNNIIDTDNQVDLSYTIGFASIHFRQIACPACMGESSEFDISAYLKLHYPTAGDYFDYMTPVNTCTTSIYSTHVSSQPIESSEPALFNDIQLAMSGQGEWFNDYIYEQQYLRNTTHAIETQHGMISNAFTTIEGFDQINPYTLLWVDPSYAFETVVSKSGTTFSWSPSLPETQFEIIVAVYSQDGSQFLGAVSCMNDDIGSMTLPGNYFTGFPYWSLAAVHFIRHKTNSTISQELNGTLQTHMMWEVVGTGHVE